MSSLSPTRTPSLTDDEPVELAFEAGYSRLQAIAERLSEAAVPVSEMCDLFAEGKGLEIALTEFLDTERARVEAIERGEGVRRFRISRNGPTTAEPKAPVSHHTSSGPDEIPF